MKPGLNDQPRRNAWPWPVDTPLDRARKVAGMYRHHLKAAAPALCGTLDDTVRGFGEDWLLDREEIIEPDQELTTAEAAELVRVPVERIRKWACADHPEKPGEPLLPRFKMRGKERTYLAEHVLAAAAAIRRYRNTHGGA